MPVQCSKNIPLSIFWILWDVVVPLLYRPRVSRKIKISSGVQKIIFWVTTQNVSLAPSGATDHYRTQNILCWVEGVCCLGWFSPKFISFNIQTKGIDSSACTIFHFAKRTKELDSGFWCWLSILCPVQCFFPFGFDLFYFSWWCACWFIDV